MKKEIYIAATAAALVSVAPHFVQAEQTVPNAEVQQQDAQLKAELTDLYKKVSELTIYLPDLAKKEIYQKQLNMSYFTSIVNGGDPATIKAELEAGVGKTLAEFKAEVEQDYQISRNHFVKQVLPTLIPDNADALQRFAEDSSKSIREIQDFVIKLSNEQNAQLRAELTELHQKVTELSEYAKDLDRREYYKQQLTMSYFTSIANGDDPKRLKAALETGVSKTFEEFKAEVEQEYLAARAHLVAQVQPVLTPERAEELKRFAEDPAKSITDIREFATKLSEEQDAQLKAELDNLYKKVSELKEHSSDQDKREYYKQQFNMDYFTSIANGGDSKKIKGALETGVGKTLAEFKAQVEQDYQHSRDVFLRTGLSALTPDRGELLKRFVEDPTTSLRDILYFATKLYEEQQAVQLRAELDNLYKKVKELSEHAGGPDKIEYYKKQLSMDYFTSIAKREDPITVKTALEAGVKKTLAEFKNFSNLLIG